MWSCWGLNWTHDSFMCVRQKRAALPKKPTMRTCSCFKKVMKSLTCRISWRPLGILFWHIPSWYIPSFAASKISMLGLAMCSCQLRISCHWGGGSSTTFGGSLVELVELPGSIFDLFITGRLVGVFKINWLTMKLWSEAMAFMNQVRQCCLPGDTVGSGETAFFWGGDWQRTLYNKQSI